MEPAESRLLDSTFGEPTTSPNDSVVEFFQCAPRPAKVGKKPGMPLHYWECTATRPHLEGAQSDHRVLLEHMAPEYLPECLQHPFLPEAKIRKMQFERIRQLVDHAFRTVPVYREKYSAVGFRPGHLLSWEDFERLPVITKREMIEAGDRALSRAHSPEFSTRSSGSSGQTLIIKVNQQAILLDTLQGARQFWHQSGLKYSRDHIAAMIYTVPWWFDTVGEDFRTAFISGLITAKRVSEILNEVKPHVISCYPTNLKALIPHWHEFDRSNLYLVVVHSEGSTRTERQQWSKELGVPVLDEYSSEEATRIALEFPCGHYHVCEDSVYLEVLDPQTHRSCPDGRTGLAVITNLLNEQMPFIRYVQGDYITRPHTPGQCLFGWSQLESIDGRVNDSFINSEGREIPAGTILDVTYRWMMQTGIHVKEFEVVQTAPDRIHATLQIDVEIPEGEKSFLAKLADLLETCMGHPVKVEATIAPTFPAHKGKKRPIRRDFKRPEAEAPAAPSMLQKQEINPSRLQAAT